jgi:endonuclease/exonuclease/phosphatase family metal-dependent hydrolase
VINTHLSAYATTESRIPQVEALLANWNNAPYTLISGDMNAHPADADTAMFAAAGLTSAQDIAGDPTALTFSSADPYERIDYIYATAELSFADFVIPQTQASDHLPLAVTVITR